MRGLLIFPVILLCSVLPVGAAELVMFDSPICEWCEIWEEEVGVVYGKTPESCAAPVRRVGLHGKRPADLSKIRGVVFTPTFVLVENGKEVGRITGYPGESHFWGMLEMMLAEVPAFGNACEKAESGTAPATAAGGNS